MSYEAKIELTFTSDEPFDQEHLDKLAAAAEVGIQAAIREGSLTPDSSEAIVELYAVVATT